MSREQKWKWTLTVNILFANGGDLDVDGAVLVVDDPGKAAEAGHADICVNDGEEGELGEQEESGDGVVRDLRIHSDTKLGKGALEGDEEENTVIDGELRIRREEWERERTLHLR